MNKSTNKNDIISVKDTKSKKTKNSIKPIILDDLKVNETIIIPTPIVKDMVCDNKPKDKKKKDTQIVEPKIAKIIEPEIFKIIKPKKQIVKSIKNIVQPQNLKLTNDSDTDSDFDSDSDTDSDTNTKPIINEKPTKTISKKQTNVNYDYLKLPENKVIFEITENNDNDEKKEMKNKMLAQIDKAHNLLYTSENIEGEDALNDIMNWLFIKAIQPLLSDKEEDGKIDFLNKKYYKYCSFNCDESDEVNNKKNNEILSYFKDLNNLISQEMIINEKSLRDLSPKNKGTDVIRQMGELLKAHPITGMIFTEHNFIKARQPQTIINLLRDVIIPMDMTGISTNEDIIGEIYEHIINGYVKKGSKLGQFFTPRPFMKLLLKYKQNRIEEITKNFIGKDKDKKILIGDTCLGTGGWVVMAFNLLKKYSSNILLTGGEVKPTTFQYGLMNIVTTQKKFPHDLICESSLTHVNNNKNHFIFTNPPFQTSKKFIQVKENFESNKYTTEKNNIKLEDVYKLQENNPPIQFLELNYFKLEENGMCIIVLPYGELFFGSSHSKTREYFMKNCNITEIIIFPGGIFTHTDIKTCALVYEKVSSGTKEIKFLESNKECTKLTKIISLTIENINNDLNKSWYCKDYLKDFYVESLVNNMTNFEWVNFGDVFTLEKGQTQSSEVIEDINGDSVFINLSQKQEFKKIKNGTLNGENLFISNTSPLGLFQYYNGKCSFSNLLHKISVNSKYINKINLKFIYYYLKSIHEHIEIQYDKGACNKSLDVKNFNIMKIPIPKLIIQEKITNKINLLNIEKYHLPQAIEILKNDIELLYDSDIKIANKKNEMELIEFGKIFTLEKGQIQSLKVKEHGEILFVSKCELNQNMLKIKSDIFYEKGLFISNTFDDNCKYQIKYIDEKCVHSDLMLLLKINKNYVNKINLKFMYYYFKMIRFHIETFYVKDLLDIKNFCHIKLQIPSIEFQNNSMDIITYAEETIKRLEKNIKQISNNETDKFFMYLKMEN